MANITRYNPFDELFNGPSAQLALYYTELFLAAVTG